MIAIASPAELEEQNADLHGCGVRKTGRRTYLVDGVPVSLSPFLVVEVLKRHSILAEQVRDSGPVQVWFNVILRAIQDADADFNPNVIDDHTNSDLRESNRHRADALGWLLGETSEPDFKFVCALCGLRGSFVREILATAYEWARPTPVYAVYNGKL